MDKKSAKSIIAKNHYFDFIEFFTSYTVTVRSARLGWISLVCSSTWEERTRESPMISSTCSGARKTPPSKGPPKKNGI